MKRIILRVINNHQRFCDLLPYFLISADIKLIMTKDKDFLHANNYICQYLFIMRKPPLYTSFFNAFRGVYMMARSERNFQIEAFAFFVNIFLIFYLKLTATDAALIIIVSSGVLAAEIFNTAVERICDIIEPEYDKRIGFIKDISAGAVILMTVVSVVVGALVYWKYISELSLF